MAKFNGVWLVASPAAFGLISARDARLHLGLGREDRGGNAHDEESGDRGQRPRGRSGGEDEHGDP